MYESFLYISPSPFILVHHFLIGRMTGSTLFLGLEIRPRCDYGWSGNSPLNSRTGEIDPTFALIELKLELVIFM
jgi:hypothetical protein